MPRKPLGLRPAVYPYWFVRKIVEKSYWQGLTDSEIKEQLDVGINTVRRVRRAFDNDEPIALKGREKGAWYANRQLQGDQLRILRGIVERNQELYPHEINKEFRTRTGIVVDDTTICRALLHSLKYTRKKVPVSCKTGYYCKTRIPVLQKHPVLDHAFVPQCCWMLVVCLHVTRFRVYVCLGPRLNPSYGAVQSRPSCSPRSSSDPWPRQCRATSLYTSTSLPP